jgi:hypothetical protein
MGQAIAVRMDFTASEVCGLPRERRMPRRRGCCWRSQPCSTAPQRPQDPKQHLAPAPATACPRAQQPRKHLAVMRQNWLSNRIFKSYDDIVDYCCYAWNTLIDQPWKIMSIAIARGRRRTLIMRVGISHDIERRVVIAERRERLIHVDRRVEHHLPAANRFSISSISGWTAFRSSAKSSRTRVSQDFQYVDRPCMS